ncbi:phage associated protein [Bergeriella denitrificans]|uniref:Phage associated protein n=1 Tax=Bergeriella denitrificans TaxID=494 RepID=A0A378URH0_BERDE|nr:phage associated protein [Bergeriella denitrificans]
MASSKGIRILKVFKALEAHPIIGISNKEISDGLGIPASYVSRDLDDLISEGLVVKLDTAILHTVSEPYKSPNGSDGSRNGCKARLPKWADGLKWTKRF